MKVGDLVRVKQTIGCHIPPQHRDRGFGVILKVDKAAPITWPGIGEFPTGDDVTVHLVTGKTEVFCEESVEVIN